MQETILSELIVTRVAACNRILRTEGVKEKREKRERFALALKHEGKTEYYAGGRTFPSDAHHVCLLPQGCSYAYRCLQAGECLMIEFEAALPFDAEPLCIETERMEELCRAFRKAEHALLSGEDSGRLTAFSCLYGMLAILEEERCAGYADSAARRLLEPALTLLASDTEHVTNETLARACGISCVYFRKLFTRVFRIPPARFRQIRRIERAKGLLLGETDSLKDVAEACGFSDQGRFSKSFRQITGMTPSAFRKEQRRE